MISYRSAVKSP